MAGAGLALLFALGGCGSGRDDAERIGAAPSDRVAPAPTAPSVRPGLPPAAARSERAVSPPPEPTKRPAATPERVHAGPVTFNRDLAPIVFGVCANCHRPGESAPFSLLSYDDVVRRAQLIAIVTKLRYMPPWKPAPGHGEFVGDRSLSDAQIASFQQWIDDGMLEGDPADLPPLPDWPKGWQAGTPDLVVELPEPFVVPADGIDVFRNFVIPIPSETERYVESIEFRPGNNRAVHHAILSIDRTGLARKLDAETPGPGFKDMKLGSERPGGQFIGWTPGKLPLPEDPRSTWTLPAGSDLIAELHMIPTGKPETVRPKVGFIFTDEPPEYIHYPLLLEFRHFTLPAGEGDIRMALDFTTPVDLEVWSIYPHAHYLGRDMRVWATLPEGGPRWLLRIDDWDFNWQDDYRYREPVFLPSGSVIHVEFSWNNSASNVRNPNQPPRDVHYGPRSTDEMGTVTLQVSPRTEADLAALEEALARHTLERWPRDWNAHRRLGYLVAERGDHAAAIRHFEVVAAQRPDDPSILYNLGRFQQLAGRLGPAGEQYRRVLALDPEHLDALNNLGVVEGSTGRSRRAIELFRRALAIDPDFEKARKNLATALALERRARPRNGGRGGD